MFQYMCKECKRLFESPVKLGEDTEKICEHCRPTVIPAIGDTKSSSSFIELAYQIESGFTTIWINPNMIEYIVSKEGYSRVELTSGTQINVKETTEEIMKKIAEVKNNG